MCTTMETVVVHTLDKCEALVLYCDFCHVTEEMTSLKITINRKVLC